MHEPRHQQLRFLEILLVLLPAVAHQRRDEAEERLHPPRVAHRSFAFEHGLDDGHRHVPRVRGLQKGHDARVARQAQHVVRVIRLERHRQQRDELLHRLRVGDDHRGRRRLRRRRVGTRLAPRAPRVFFRQPRRARRRRAERGRARCQDAVHQLYGAPVRRHRERHERRVHQQPLARLQAGLRLHHRRDALVELPERVGVRERVRELRRVARGLAQAVHQRRQDVARAHGRFQLRHRAEQRLERLEVEIIREHLRDGVHQVRLRDVVFALHHLLQDARQHHVAVQREVQPLERG